MVRASEAGSLNGLPQGLLSSLCLSAAEADFRALALMWMLMAAAMMLPGFAPALRTFVYLADAGAASARTALALVAGYLGIWLAASLAGAAAQAQLARSGLVAPNGQSVALWLNAVLLVGAGLVQFSALKAACLSKCRMPMTFYIARWRPGARAAFGMGAELGLACLGCCWALMALGFVGGTMNLAWTGAATLFMAAEKLPEIGRRLTRPAGCLLIGAGVLTALGAANLV